MFSKIQTRVAAMRAALWAFIGAMVLNGTNLLAAADPDVTALNTVVTDSFTVVKATVIVLITFGIVLGLIKWLRKGNR